VPGAEVVTHLAFLSMFWHPLGQCSGTVREVARCRSYNWWSGIASDVSEVTLLAGALAVYKQHNCKGCWWCPLWAHHKVDGTTASVCHWHHTLAHHHKLQLRHKRRHAGRLAHGESPAP
jgi:hypothetical protein